MKKYIANIITSLRIVGSILMILVPILSFEFYVIYLSCGFSDMIDGFVARKTDSVSEFGAKFDTIADFVFTIVSLIKWLNIIYLSEWIYIWIFIIGIIKISNIVSVIINNKTLISIHTFTNKITGILLFLWPLTISFVKTECSSVLICLISTISIIHEIYYIKINRRTVL